MNAHKIKCSKCEGSGKLIHYSHIANGNCFQCEGKGFKLLTDKQFNEYKDEQETIDQKAKEALEAELNYEQELKQHKEEQEKIKQENVKKFQDKLSYIGNIGDKFELKLKYIKRNSTRYGEQYLLQDENKNSIVFYSRDIHIVEGDLMHLKGTVKDHKEFNGYKQTVLKNVKVLNEIIDDED